MSVINETPHPGVYTSVPELLKIRQLAKDLTLETRRQSQALLEGSVRTRYRGRGMEFAEVRPYQAGDDIRTIDWRVTARMQAPYTKLFQEEHERPVFVTVDQRAGMFFGSQRRFKSVFAAEFAAVVAWTAQNNNDRIGALIFGNNQQADIRARRGKHGVLALLNRLSEFNNALDSPLSPAGSTALSEMLRDTSRVAKPGSLILLISDFRDFTEPCVELLSMLARRSDVMAVQVYDSLEAQLPRQRRLTVSNGQQRLTLDTAQVGEPFRERFLKQQLSLREACTRYGVQYVSAPSDQPFEPFVADLLKPRKSLTSRRKTVTG